MAVAAVVLIPCVAVMLVIGFLLGMITQWRCRAPQSWGIVNSIKAYFHKQQQESDDDKSNDWTAQGPGPLQHAFSFQVDATDGELLAQEAAEQGLASGVLDIAGAPTMACGIIDEDKARVPLRRLLSVASTPGNDRTPIAREIQAAIPSTEIGKDELHLVEIVGKGAFGTVYKGTWRGAPVAVKKTTLSTDDAGGLQQSQWEAVLSEHLRHPNVVQTFAWTVHTGVHLEEEATAVDLSILEQALSQTKLSEVLLSTGVRGVDAAGNHEGCAPKSGSEVPACDLKMVSGGERREQGLGPSSGSCLESDRACTADDRHSTEHQVPVGGSGLHAGKPDSMIQGTGIDAEPQLAAGQGSTPDVESDPKSAPEATACDHECVQKRQRPGRPLSAFAVAQAPHAVGVVPDVPYLQRWNSIGGSLASMPSGAFTLSGAMSEASAFFASLPAQDGRVLANTHSAHLPETARAADLQHTKQSKDDLIQGGSLESEQQDGRGADEADFAIPARHAPAAEEGRGFTRTGNGKQAHEGNDLWETSKLPIKRKLDFQEAEAQACTLDPLGARASIPVGEAVRTHEASSNVSTCMPAEDIDPPRPARDYPSRASARDAEEDERLSNASSLQSDSDSVSLQSNGLPRIRTGRPPLPVEQVGPATLPVRRQHGRHCQPLESCLMQGMSGDTALAGLCHNWPGDSPEYAQSPCGDTLMPLHSISAGSQLDRRQRGQSADGSEVSFNSDDGFGSPHLTCRKSTSAAMLGMVETPGEASNAVVLVVMEYCDLGSLLRAIRRRTFKPHGQWGPQITYRALLRTAQEVAKGMEYIHSRGIIHGDLKPGNVLLKTHRIDRRGYIAKVSDFGLSVHPAMQRVAGEGQELLGTIAYTAPEVLQDASLLQMASDVYAFGLLMWEMYNCQTLYDGLVEAQIYQGVLEGTLRPSWDDSVPAVFKDLACACWDQDPVKRPSFEGVVHCLTTIEVDFRKDCYRNKPKTPAAQSRTRRSALLQPSPLAQSQHASTSTDELFQ